MNLKFKKFWPLIVLLLIVLAIPLTIILTQRPQELRQKAAAATVLSFSESAKTVGKGQSFSVNAMVSTGVNIVAGVELRLKYDATKLKINTISVPAKGTLLPQNGVIAQNIDNTKGQAEIVILSNPSQPAQGENLILAQINITALQPVASSEVRFSTDLDYPTKIAGVNGSDLGKQVLQSTVPLQVTVVDPSPTPTPRPTPSPSPTPRPTPSPSPTPAPTLSVTLTANPNTGTAPLNNVSLTAQVSGTATGTIQYSFDCTNNGTYELNFSTTTNPYTATNLCNYSTAGTYTARVYVVRQGVNAANTKIITVTVAPSPSPSPSPSPTPRPTPSPSPTPRPTPSPSPTPTPSPVLVNLRFALQSIDQDVTSPTYPPGQRVIQMQVTVKQNNVIVANLPARAAFVSIVSMPFVAPNGETFNQNVALFKLQSDISNLVPNIPTAFTLKGPMHLSKSVTQTLNSGNNIVDFTTSEPKTLLAGDIEQETGLNNIDIFDYNKFVADFLAYRMPGGSGLLYTSDFNMDGEVSIMDYPYIPFNFGKSGN